MNEIYKKCSEKFIATMAIFVAITATAELAVFFILKYYNSAPPAQEYMYYQLAVPSGISALAYLATIKIIKINNIPFSVKKWTVLSDTWLTCTLIMFAHSQLPASMGIIAIPVVGAAVFNDRRTSDITTAMCMCSVLFLQLCNTYSVLPFIKTNTLNYNCIIVILVILAARICTGILTLYIKLSVAEINFRSEKQVSLERQLSRDPMTCLYNHSAFNFFLAKEISAAKNKETNLSLAVMDIDNFKMVNDTYGHDNGDKVIIRLSEILLKHSTDNEYACRYGGEEFSVIFLGKTPEEAEKIVQKIMKEFRAQRYEGIDRTFSISVGLAGYDKTKDNADRLFKKADSLLYNAKSTGKNCCRIKPVEITEENRTKTRYDSRAEGWNEHKTENKEKIDLNNIDFNTPLEIKKGNYFE